MSKMKRQSFGFTLLEVLVAVVIVSLGMLGVAALLVTVHKANTSSYIQQQAVQTAYDMLDRMRANLQGAQAGYYSKTYTPPFSPPGTSCVGTGNTCTAQQLANFDTSQWASTDLTVLPQGSANVTSAVSTNGNVSVTVTVNWSDAPAQAAIEKTGSSARALTLTTVL
jgi:type IV pilus assembly protein PilV